MRGKTTAFAYDGDHRLTTVTVSNPAVAAAPYAVLTNSYTGGRVASQQDADGFTVAFGYDYTTGRTTVTNERKKQTLYSFDERYRATGMQGATGYVARFSFDTGNLALGTSQVQSFTAGTSGWTLAQASLTAPAGATRAVIRMVVTSLNATIYVDGFAFE